VSAAVSKLSQNFTFSVIYLFIFDKMEDDFDICLSVAKMIFIRLSALNQKKFPASRRNKKANVPQNVAGQTSPLAIRHIDRCITFLAAPSLLLTIQCHYFL